MFITDLTKTLDNAYSANVNINTFLKSIGRAISTVARFSLTLKSM